MYSDHVTKEPNGKKRLEAIRIEASELVQAERFYLTEALSMEEPNRTFSLYALDGIRLDGDENRQVVDPAARLDLPPVRLVVINPESNRAADRTTCNTIRHKGTRIVNVPGRGKETVHEWKDYGTDKVLPADVARAVLVRDGYPCVNVSSRDSRRGNVVEYAWIEAEIKKPACHPDTKRAWDTIQARLKPEPSTPPSTKNKQGAAQATL